MGADFIYITAPRVSMTPERKEQIFVIIDALTPDDMDGYLDDVDDEGNLDIEPEKKRLKEIIADYNDFDNRRDTGDIMDSDGSWKYITGGMSWGDDPTDAFSTLYQIVNCPKLYDALHKFALEDVTPRK